MPGAAGFEHLLVGTETDDDAAVYRVNPRQAIVVTTDFFMPVVDDPFDFGRIAAANALSDVYAMGGKPVLALAVVGMPIDAIPEEVVQDILAGGASVCTAAGIPVAGGHSIDSPEPIYGLVAIGTVDPARVIRNSTAQAGDQIILTKRLGVGIYSAALKRQELAAPLYREMVESMTQLNAVGAEMNPGGGVHAMTDVTGFGLLGHLLEMCRGASLGAELRSQTLPLLSSTETFAKKGIGTGGAKRNWNSYGHEVESGNHLPEWLRDILCDPQTSGGLLIACARDFVPGLLQFLGNRGFVHAGVVGEFVNTPPLVRVV